MENTCLSKMNKKELYEECKKLNDIITKDSGTIITMGKRNEDLNENIVYLQVKNNNLENQVDNLKNRLEGIIAIAQDGIMTPLSKYAD